MPVSKMHKSSQKSKKNTHPIHLTLSTTLGDEDCPSAVREAYKSTRTRIMFSLGNDEDNPVCRVLALTSAMPGEGKTTSCINVATAFAQTGARVLVVDADLRKPTTHKYTKLDNEVGLANILAGFCRIEEYQPRATKLGFDIITSGSIPPNPAELLAGVNLKKMLDHFRKQYDYIFLDTPPVHVVTDGIIISQLVDAVILVTRQKYTTHDLVEKALDTLEIAEARVLGFILNDAEEAYLRTGYRYKSYRYRYGYGYGYGYGVNTGSVTQKDKQ